MDGITIPIPITIAIMDGIHMVIMDGIIRWKVIIKDIIMDGIKIFINDTDN